MHVTYDGGWIALNDIARSLGFDRATEMQKALVKDLKLEVRRLAPRERAASQLYMSDCVSPKDAEALREIFIERHQQNPRNAPRRTYNKAKPPVEAKPPVKAEPPPNTAKVVVEHDKCGVHWCSEPVRALGLCVTHWQAQHIAFKRANDQSLVEIAEILRVFSEQQKAIVETLQEKLKPYLNQEDT